MAVKDTKEFVDFQTRECDEIPEEVLPPIICPTCTPNPTAQVPVWYEEEDPFLNERDCLYQVAVITNDEKEYLDPSIIKQIRDHGANEEQYREIIAENYESIINMAIDRGFLRAGIRDMLRYYQKLEANETVCAVGTCRYSPNQLDEWREEQEQLLAYYTQIDDISSVLTLGNFLMQSPLVSMKQKLENMIDILGEVHPLGLEWVATIDDIHIDFQQTSKGGVPIKFLVSVPAFNFDMIPPDPLIDPDEDEDSPLDEVELDAAQIRGQLNRLQSSLFVFSQYQAYFSTSVQNGGEGGRIYFKDFPGETWRAQTYKEEIRNFREDLLKFLDNNGYRLPFQLGFGRDLVSKIKIIFDNSDEKKKYIVKRIKVKSEGCRGWLKVGKKRPKIFRNTNKIQRTLMGYVAKINDIDQRLRARKTIEWLEFVETYTYPQIKVDYGHNSGNMPQDEKTALRCLLENEIGLGSGGVQDYLLGEVLSLWDIIAYKFNQRSCKEDVSEDNPSREAIEAQKAHQERIYLDLMQKHINEKRRKAIDDAKVGKTGKEKRDAVDQAKELWDLDPDEFKARYGEKAKELEEKARKEVESYGNRAFPQAKMAALERFGYEDSLVSLVFSAYRRSNVKLARPTGARFKQLIQRMGLCGMTGLLKKAIECLLGGMDLQTAYRTMIKAALEKMSGDNLGKLFGGLPYDKQQEVLSKVQQIIGDVPPPWSKDFKAGETTTTFSGPPGVDLSGEQEYFDNLDRSEQRDYIENEGYEDIQVEEGVIVEQGSIGKATAQVASTVVNAYIEAIMDTASMEMLMNELDKFPGARIVANVILSLTCPHQPLFQPSLKGFLKTLTLDVCDPSIGITWPRLKSLPMPFWQKFLERLKEAVIEAIKEMWIRILDNLIYKLLVTLESILCRSLEALGQFAADAVNPNVTGTSLRDAFREAFCGPEEMQSDNEVDLLIENSINYLGFTPNESDLTANPAERLMAALSNTTTKNEILGMMVMGPLNHDPRALDRMANVVNVAAPEFSDALGSPEQISDMFASLGNFLSPENREQIKLALLSQIPDTPINTSICLTNEEFEEWNQMRQDILSSSGLNEDEAAEYVKDLNDKAIDRLSDLAGELMKLDGFPGEGGTSADGSHLGGGIFGDDFSNILDPNGDGQGGQSPPGCTDSAMSNMMNPTKDPDIGPTFDSMTEKIFDEIALDYTNDLMGRKGLFNFIMADTQDKVYTSHVRLTRNFLTGRFYANSEEDANAAEEDNWFPELIDDYGFFPTTISMDLRDKMIEQEIDFKINKDIAPRKTYNTTIKYDGITKNLDVKRVRRAFKKPDFEIKYSDFGEIPDPTDPEETIEANYNLIGGFSTAVGNNDGFKKNLNYQASFYTKTIGEDSSSKFLISRFVVENPPTSKESQIISEIDPNDEWSPNDTTYIAYLFRKFINYKWSESSNPNPVSNDNIYNGIQTHTINLAKNLLLTKPGADPLNADPADISNGFLFGYEVDDLNTDPEYFEYVRPNGEPYDLDEEEAVLGRMKKEHPRVHVLNPEIYGGKYSDPNYYIEPPEKNGWLGLIDSMVPEADACAPKRADLLDIESIKRRAKEVQHMLPYDERLSMERVCALEVPFDHIVDNTTHGNIEGVIASIIRTYLIQYYMLGLPAFANLRATSGNYDDCFFEFVADRMKDGMEEQGPFWFTFSKIKYNNYWLLFLEQCVQVYQRKLEFGEVEPSERIEEVLSTIGTAQMKYKWPEDRDDVEALRGDNRRFNLPGRILEISDIGKGRFYRWAMAYQVWEDNMFTSSDEVVMRHGFYPWLIKNLRFATKILTIRIVRKECMEILKELIKHEANIIFEKFNQTMKPRSPISNINKYMLGIPEYCVGSSLRIGKAKYLIEKQTEGEIADPGNIPHVISNPQSQSPLDGHTVDSTTLSKSGLFILEKYLRLEDKKDQSNVPNFIKDRPANLFGVVNLKDFQNFITENRSAAKVYKYSDCFGDMEFLYSVTMAQLREAGYSWDQIQSNYLFDKDTKEIKQIMKNPSYSVKVPASAIPSSLTENFEPAGITGSIGVRYGIRLCYVPPSGFSGGNVSADYAMRQKAFNVKANGPANTKYIFPIAEGEIDLLDAELSDFNWKDHDTDPYDLECMVDKLLLQPEYKMFFERFIPLKSYTSFFACFISLGFLPALGQAEGERDKGADNGFFTPNDPEGLSGWDRLLFDDTRRTCRRLFADFYNSNDFNPEDDNTEDATIKDFLKNANPFTNVTPSILTWWQRRRLSKRPFNKKGESCGNPFMDIFEK